MALKPFDRAVINFLARLFALGCTMFVVGGIGGLLIFHHFNKDLPDYTALAKYDPAIVTRIYAGDGRLMAEYATEKRIYVPLQAIPSRVVSAFLSAEDKNFYHHTGLDFSGLARAVKTNLNQAGQGRGLVGGSTITQQVVKNFLLTREQTFERKIKEAILALKISQVYSKDRILELYLNDIYLGLGSYGVAAAALNYFNKSLDELSLEEAALLAAMPKAPANYNPKTNYAEAKGRRDWVLDRMAEDKVISMQEAERAKVAPITLRIRDAAEVVKADFFSEEVRRQLAAMYGNNILYAGGLSVKTTLDARLQGYADQALRHALVDYDRRKGYRGPLKKLGSVKDMDAVKAEVAKLSVPLYDPQQLAIITAVDEKAATIALIEGGKGTIPMELLKWTRRVVNDAVGPEVKKPGDILAVGDVVIVAPASGEEAKKLPESIRKQAFDLQQIPEVNGALVALDPHTGRVLALSGGYSYGKTEFNRATQARRQPGSSFKPFVYLTGLENGFTPSTVILDAPVEMSQGAGQPNWRPQNYKDEYLGPTTMRVGLEKSRNTMTVRLAQMTGIDRVLEVAKRFGIYQKPPRNFSIVLGASETTLLKLANAYGMLVNGGKRINASLIERIDDRRGKTIYRRDTRVCEQCRMDVVQPGLNDERPPIPVDNREQVVDPRIAYQMVSMLQGVVERGTATRAQSLKKILAGKTGTTNNSFDTWFVGFSPDLVVGVYVGYDKPRTLGKKETGGNVALPGFMYFMEKALADKPSTPFRMPRGIQLVKTDLHSGLPVGAGQDGGKVILEAFVAPGDPIYIPGVTTMPGAGLETGVGGAQQPTNPDGSPANPGLFGAPGTQTPPAPSNYEAPKPPVTGTGGLY